MEYNICCTRVEESGNEAMKNMGMRLVQYGMSTWE